LLDTHAFIWWVTNDSQLSDAARACIADPDNDVLSTASAWDYHQSQHRKTHPARALSQSYIPSRLASNQFESLPIQMNHVLQVSTLPNHHRDPFDRF